MDKRHLAFETYYRLYDDRNYIRVAIQLGLSKATISKWAKEDNWKERVKEREKEVLSRIKEEAIQEDAERRREAITDINYMTDMFMSALREGKVQIKTVSDYEKLMRLEMDLRGMGIEGDKDRTIISDEEMKAKMDEIINVYSNRIDGLHGEGNEDERRVNKSYRCIDS